ncbi:MAG: DnaA/Hda family protein [Lautropia sp.]
MGSPPPAPGTPPDQLLLDFGPPPAPTLHDFVVGSNAECVATLAALSGSPARVAPLDACTHRFVYVWGPSGSGKTHLARALSSSPSARAGRLEVADDCDRLDTAGQVALFHRFNELLATPGAALVAFGAEAPGRLSLIPELSSRLAWGIVFALAPLDEDALREALRAAARDRGAPLDEEVIAWLLRHTRRDMRSLRRILDRLDRLSLQRQRRISLALLRELRRQDERPLR